MPSLVISGLIVTVLVYGHVLLGAVLGQQAV